MKKYLFMLCLIAVTFYSNPQAFAMDDSMPEYSHQKTISNGFYIGGGVASIFLGFGIGTAIQGRYEWVHTVTQGLCVAGLITTGILTVENTISSRTIDRTSLYVYIGLGVALGGLRIWEIIDTWILPSDYKIAKTIKLSPNLYTTNNGENLGLGLSLNYKF